MGETGLGVGFVTALGKPGALFWVLPPLGAGESAGAGGFAPLGVACGLVAESSMFSILSRFCSSPNCVTFIACVLLTLLGCSS